MGNDRVVISKEAVVTAARVEAALSIAEKVALLEQIEIEQPALVAELLSGRSIGVPELHLEALMRVLTVCFLTLRMLSIRWKTITMANLLDALESAQAIRARYAAATTEADKAGALPRFDEACEPLIAYVLGEAQRCAPRHQSVVTEFMLIESVMLALCVDKLMAQRRVSG